MAKRIIYTCTFCGSEDVMQDGMIALNSDDTVTYDNYYCQNCDGECKVNREEVEDNTEPTNADRAARISGILPKYFQLRGGERDEDDTDISDMLTDIMHYCKAKNFEFDDVLQTAIINYSTEINEELKGEDNHG